MCQCLNIRKCEKFVILVKKVYISAITNRGIMFKATWDKFLKTVSNDDSPSMRRRFPRRAQDVCIIEINGTQYPVKDWSMGGALIETTDRSFTLGETIPFNIKFKLKDRVVEIDHEGTILRKSKTQIALKFAPLPGESQSEFDRVVQDAG